MLLTARRSLAGGPAAHAAPGRLGDRRRVVPPADIRPVLSSRLPARSMASVPIANEYNYYTPSGSTDTAGSFAYWTDPVVDYNTTTSAPVGDSNYTLVSAQDKNAPAPWVPYTRAGCDFG